MGVNGRDYGVELDLHCMDHSWVGAKRHRLPDGIQSMIRD
jgi:hypothetical protein